MNIFKNSVIFFKRVNLKNLVINSKNTTKPVNFYMSCYNKFNFARNIPKSQINKIEANSEESRLSEENQENFDLVNSNSNSKNINEDIPLIISNLNEVIFNFYLKSKQFQLHSTREYLHWENKENLHIYNFIVSNLKLLKEEKQISLFIRAIGYYKINDSKTIETLSRVFVISDRFKKARLSMLSFYTMIKLQIIDENLQSKLLQAIKETDLLTHEKETVNPFIWALSEKEISNKEINENIDLYIKNKIEEFNEYDLSIIFRFYSKIFYLNYEVLGLILQKCLKYCPNLSLRYILIITKCLAEMNIRNLNLLTGIQERMKEIIKLNSEDQYNTQPLSEFNRLTPDAVTQLLSNLVKLEFLEYEEFYAYETLFFNLAEKNGLKNKESVFSIISTHCKFINRLFKNLESKKKDISTNETDVENIKQLKHSQDRTKKSFIKLKKEYKLVNETFIEKIMPYLDIYKDQMNFSTCLNLILIIKNMKIYKRKNLRSLLQFYLYIMDKFMSKEQNKEVKSQGNEKINFNYFLSTGFKIFDYAGQREEIITRCEKYGVLYEKLLPENKNYKINQEDNKEQQTDTTHTKSSHISESESDEEIANSYTINKSSDK
jgi:hypothetical protein